MTASDWSENAGKHGKCAAHCSLCFLVMVASVTFLPVMGNAMDSEAKSATQRIVCPERRDVTAISNHVDSSHFREISGERADLKPLFAYSAIDSLVNGGYLEDAIDVFERHAEELGGHYGNAAYTQSLLSIVDGCIEKKRISDALSMFGKLRAFLKEDSLVHQAEILDTGKRLAYLLGGVYDLCRLQSLYDMFDVNNRYSRVQCEIAYQMINIHAAQENPNKARECFEDLYCHMKYDGSAEWKEKSLFLVIHSLGKARDFATALEYFDKLGGAEVGEMNAWRVKSAYSLYFFSSAFREHSLSKKMYAILRDMEGKIPDSQRKEFQSIYDDVDKMSGKRYERNVF